MSFSPIVLFQSWKESAGILNCLKYLFIYLWKKSVSYNYLPLQPTRRMSHLDALAEKLNSENDKTGFFQMVNRSSRLNASSYSLSSLYSVGSINCGSTVSGFTTTGSRHESARNRRSSLWQGPSAIKALYSLLLEPMEDEFPEEGSEIMLVLESNLFMVRIRYSLESQLSCRNLI